jgi:hypothetical protein
VQGMVQGEEPDRTKLQGPKCEKENAPKRIFMQDVVREAERTARPKQGSAKEFKSQINELAPPNKVIQGTGFRKTC